MSIRALFFVLALVPAMAMAQGGASKPAQEPKFINAATRVVLLANKPDGFTEEQWLVMMQKPMNRNLYPLRLTQAMLDTIGAEKLDLQFRYAVMRDRGVQAGPTPR